MSRITRIDYEGEGYTATLWRTATGWTVTVGRGETFVSQEHVSRLPEARAIARLWTGLRDRATARVA